MTTNRTDAKTAALDAMIIESMQRIDELEAEVERLTTDRTVDEMLQDLRRRYGSYVHLSANYNDRWWVAWGVGPQNRTGYYLVPSEAIRAAWEAVCKEPQP